MDSEVEKAKKEHFNDIYKELIEIVGYENMIKLHEYYAGQYIIFPKRVLKESYIHQRIVEEYDGANAWNLARKYNYSYSWIMKILKNIKMGSHQMKELYKKKNLENIQSLKNDIRLFAKENELVIQETDEADDSSQWVCQMKKESKLSLEIASKATTVIIDDFSDDTVKISVGQGKWLSKIAGSAATALVTGPLFLIAGATAVTGIFGQMSLTKRVIDLVEVNFN